MHYAICQLDFALNVRDKQILAWSQPRYYVASQLGLTYQCGVCFRLCIGRDMRAEVCSPYFVFYQVHGSCSLNDWSYFYHIYDHTHIHSCFDLLIHSLSQPFTVEPFIIWNINTLFTVSIRVRITLLRDVLLCRSLYVLFVFELG